MIQLLFVHTALKIPPWNVSSGWSHALYTYSRFPVGSLRSRNESPGTQLSKPGSENVQLLVLLSKNWTLWYYSSLQELYNERGKRLVCISTSDGFTENQRAGNSLVVQWLGLQALRMCPVLTRSSNIYLYPHPELFLRSCVHNLIGELKSHKRSGWPKNCCC